MLISRILVTYWFYTVCNIVTILVNFRENIYLNMNYNYSTTIYGSIFAQIYTFLVENIF